MIYPLQIISLPYGFLFLDISNIDWMIYPLQIKGLSYGANVVSWCTHIVFSYIIAALFVEWIYLFICSLYMYINLKMMRV